jgi:hypothetical protein
MCINILVLEEGPHPCTNDNISNLPHGIFGNRSEHELLHIQPLIKDEFQAHQTPSL